VHSKETAALVPSSCDHFLETVEMTIFSPSRLD
jgi:hypothetical protein